jgi:hypothetical protein
MPSLMRGVFGSIVYAAIALGSAVSDPGEPAPLVPAALDPTIAVRAPLVIAGVAGLRWEDVSPERTPALWRLLDDGASAGAVTVYTSGRPSCGEGGWLSVSAGRAVASASFGPWCHPLPAILQSGTGAHVDGWTELAEERLDSIYHPQIGTLGAALAESHVCATAVGPGAAVALADRTGTVARYEPAPSADAFGCPLTVVDLGRTTIFDDVADERMPVDESLEELVALVPPGTDLVIISVSAPAAAPLALGVGVVATQRAVGETDRGHLLSSPSTRWDGVFRLLDLPSTITAALGVPEPAQFNGSPILVGGERPDTAAMADGLATLTSKDRALRQVSASLVSTLSTSGLVLVGAAVLALRRRRPGATRSAWRSPTGSPALRLGLLTVAAAPVSAYLVGLVPWWRSSHPVETLWLSIGVIALVLALMIQIGCRRLAAIWWPALLLSGLTVAVLLADALLGTPLHRLSPFGPSAVTGGRYYGLGNSSFAILGAHAIILGGALAAWALARGRRTPAVPLIAAVGICTLLIDAGPTWGADLGGAPALLPAFVVLGVVVSGARMTWRRTVTTGAAAVVLLAAIGFLDWLRPSAQRSHAGRFVQSIIDGDAWETVSRKGTFALATLTSGAVAAITVMIFIALVLWVRRPEADSPPEIEAALVAWPTMRATAIALLIVLGLGALANDYGVRVITIGLTAAVPLLMAAMLGSAGPQSGCEAESQPGGKLPARGSIAGTS